MNISIVIPNYNGAKIMKKNLPIVYEAVKDYKKGKVEIIITDDPSNDDSKAVIEEFAGKYADANIEIKTLFNQDKNKAGFSKNVNRGVKSAKGDILILLNTDVAPHKDFLECLLRHFSDSRVFATACMDESIEESAKVLRGRGIGRWTRGFLQHAKGNNDKDTTLWASGGSSAFRREYWDRLGGLDELYNPFYWEDIDLSYRAWKSGYKVVFENRSRVVHEHEGGSIKSNIKSSKVIATAYRNQFIFVWLDITDLNLLFSHLIWFPYHIITAIIRRDLLFVKGFFQAFIRLPGILRSRGRYTKLFTETDRQVLEMFRE